MKEEWKDIIGYEGHYQISNFGRVKSVKKWDVNRRSYVACESILSPTDNGNGYMIIGLCGESSRKNHYVHRLVASAFVENPKKCNYVNHLDHDRKNNVYSNLEWCDQAENIQYSADRMRHEKSVSHSGTGEKCIYYRKKSGRYRIVIRQKEYGSCKTLQEAVNKRDSIIRGGSAL